jgi:oxygen-independent coproporphyrinogen-3 oxidase
VRSAIHLPELIEAAKAPLGLYIHVPYCMARCAYCGFVTTKHRDSKNRFLDRLEADLCAWGKALERPTLDTLYLGGGTPSILDTGEITRIFGTVRDSFDLSGIQEATIEANPGTADLVPGG